jgi:ketosteroid isomerase-like protein
MNEMRMREQAESYFASIASDLPQFLRQFAPNGSIEDARGVQYRGDKAISAYVARMIAPFQRIGFQTERVIVARDQAAIRWSAKGALCTGKPVDFDGVTVLRFNRSGQITSVRDYHQFGAPLARTA